MFNLRHSFPGQKQNEPVFIFLRRHPVSFIGYALIFAIMVALGIFLYWAVFNLNFFNDEMIFNIGVIVANSFLMASVAFFFVAVLDFYFDIHIVTNRRIVDIDQNRLFHRQIDELALEDIEDTSSIVAGILGTFFSYGNTEIQTAGSKPNFIFENIPNPREVSQLILDLSEQAKRGVLAEDRLPTIGIEGIIGSSIIRDPEKMMALGAWPKNLEKEK